MQFAIETGSAAQVGWTCSKSTPVLMIWFKLRQRVTAFGHPGFVGRQVTGNDIRTRIFGIHAGWTKVLAASHIGGWIDLMIVSMITYAGDDQSIQMVRRLIKVDENRFGGLVGATLTSSSAWRNPFGVAYRVFDIGDPAMDKRIAVWGESQLTTKAGTTAAQMKRWWAEAAVDKYGAAPTERQRVGDPLASRLSFPLAEAIHNELLRLAVEALEKRSRK